MKILKVYLGLIKVNKVFYLPENADDTADGIITPDEAIRGSEVAVDDEPSAEDDIVEDIE